MFHSGYALLGVKVWGSWQSDSYHDYIWCDMHATRGVGGHMAAGRGLSGRAKIKPREAGNVTFRNGGGKKGCAIPTREISRPAKSDIEASQNLWFWREIQSIPHI